MSHAADVRSLTRWSLMGVEGLVDDVVTTMRADQVPGWQPDDGLGEGVRLVMRDVFGEFLKSVGKGADRMTAGNTATLDRSIHLRLDQGAILPDVLHSYRVGGAGIWRHLARGVQDDAASSTTLVAVTPRILGLLDQYSLHVDAVYRELGGRTARRQEEATDSLLDTVLFGTPTQGLAYWDAVADLRIPRRGTFVAVEVGNDVTPLIDADLEFVIGGLKAVDSVWLRRGPRSQTGLLLLRGAGARVEDVGAAVFARAGTPVGLSASFASIEQASAARVEAGVAVASASAHEPVVQYDRDILGILMASSPHATNTLVTTSLGDVLDLPPDRFHPLLETVRMWLRHNKSVNAAAAALHCHRNTVNYRLRRFETLAGGRFIDESWRTRVALAINAHQQLAELNLERHQPG